MWEAPVCSLSTLVLGPACTLPESTGTCGTAQPQGRDLEPSHPLAFPEELLLLLSPSSPGAGVGLMSVIAAVTKPWLVLREGTFALVQNNCSAEHPVGSC